MQVTENNQTVIQMVLFDVYPPSNPAVVLSAAREWFLVYGADDVYRQMVDWLREIGNIRPYDLDLRRSAQGLFARRIAEA